MLVWCLSSIKKIDSNITYAPDIHLMTTRELTSAFDFWSAGHPRMAVVHLPMKFGADIFIQSGLIEICLFYAKFG